MKITREEVLRVAELAHLGLSPDEVEIYQKQLDAILSYVDKLNEIDVSAVEPMAQILHPFSVGVITATGGIERKPFDALREDALQPCQIADDVLAQSADSAKPFFRVPKVIDR